MTAQMADSLIYKEKQFDLFANPLENYFEINPPRPNFVAGSTANRKGFLAEWEIDDDRLYLVGLSGSMCVKPHEVTAQNSYWCRAKHHGECEAVDICLDDFFEVTACRVFANWYSGEVRLPHGEMLEYVHSGFGSKYERYLMIDIEAGDVSGTRIIGLEEHESEQAEWSARYWTEKDAAKKQWWQLWR
jgi:hypothetical protein